MILPTIGRVVHFYPAPSDGIPRLSPDAPLAALVTYVHGPQMVNLAVFDHYGQSQHRTGVRLIQDGDAKPADAYAEWMPYQKGQAAKTEALEAKLSGGRSKV